MYTWVKREDTKAGEKADGSPVWRGNAPLEVELVEVDVDVVSVVVLVELPDSW